MIRSFHCINLLIGGPGGSGVQFLKAAGKALQSVVDMGQSPNTTTQANNQKFYDTISWDPRGIGRTLPGLRCFPDAFSRDIWNSQKEAVGLLGSSESDTVFEQVWARAEAVGLQCSLGGENRTKIAKFMNSPCLSHTM